MKRRYFFMLAFTLVLTACSTDQTIKTGATSDRLSPCPNSPNCVSSLSENKSHQVKRSEIVTAENNYLHATFKSFLFRFVDDVEFSFDDEKKTIDVRSASRTGYSDFGQNRRRVEEIRKRFMAR